MLYNYICPHLDFLHNIPCGTDQTVGLLQGLERSRGFPDHAKVCHTDDSRDKCYSFATILRCIAILGYWLQFKAHQQTILSAHAKVHSRVWSVQSSSQRVFSGYSGLLPLLQILKTKLIRNSVIAELALHTTWL